MGGECQEIKIYLLISVGCGYGTLLARLSLLKKRQRRYRLGVDGARIGKFQTEYKKADKWVERVRPQGVDK